VTDRLIYLSEVCATTSLSRSTIYRMIDRCEFPQQVQISRNRVAWYQSQIEQWLRNPMGWVALESVTQP